MHSGLGETGLTPDAAPLSWWAEHGTQARPCWTGLGVGPAWEEVYPAGCTSATGYWSDYVHTS